MLNLLEMIMCRIVFGLNNIRSDIVLKPSTNIYTHQAKRTRHRIRSRAHRMPVEYRVPARVQPSKYMESRSILYHCRTCLGVMCPFSWLLAQSNGVDTKQILVLGG